MEGKDYQKLLDHINSKFYPEYVESLKGTLNYLNYIEFVRIPSLSSIFDKDWQTNGNLTKQMNHLISSLNQQKIQGATVHALQDEGRSPFLIVDIAPTDPANTNTVLLYGHMDKQPFGEGWDTDPCDPVIKADGKMYGRGSSDDGYSFFSSLHAIKACQD